MNQQEYLTRLAARFPGCVTAEGLARPDKLAARENAACRRSWERSMPTFAGVKPAEVRARRLMWATVLARISPVTSFTAADALGVPYKSISGRMDALEQAGFAVRIPGVKPITWRITLPEAAE